MKTKVGTRAKRSGWAATLVVLMAAATPAVGEDRTVMDLATIRVEPNLRSGLKPDVALKIRSGFSLAVSRVRTIPQCAALFRDLGGDPVDLLARSFYYPVQRNQTNRACSNGALLFTSVGSPVVWVCDRFARVGTDKASLMLLHEALHFAGLREQPRDPGAMTPSEIDDMVEAHCGH